MSVNWDAVGAVSDGISATIVTIACVYAYFQLREARVNRHLTALLAFQEKYHSIEAREFRRRLLSKEFGSPEEFDADRLSREDFHRFWQMLDQLEVLGVLVEKRHIDIDLVIACFHRSPPMVWAAVKPYIEARRATASPLESVHLENLVQRYRRSAGLPADFWDRLGVR
ncbi:hypothetical protein FB565_004277 [Actinoplanes lutulentus]|uniref:DUF4760 domain-containing protein n=1 Tax=Actinoplanes lutulentus TaxID=1287878 RepID=A0A327ZIW5_9ACTN|nr:hypothetical protein [Actinoplanes lutulentus]MBB2944548.1 hypothetical protein [Actinoplanes lutulentus]RAK42221.1 hypothetical protein B0I29_10246 [Actinoplanes lutulentus]